MRWSLTEVSLGTCETVQRPRTAITWLALGFAIAALSPSTAAESTALLDVRLILEPPGQPLYAEPLALQMLRTQLPQTELTAPEAQPQVRRWVWDFTKSGFQKNRAGLRLFRNEHETVRREFLEIVQGTSAKLTTGFLREVYQDFGAQPDTHDFQAFTEPAWLEFNRQLKDPPTGEALLALLRSRADPQDLEQYLPVLYFGYRVFDDQRVTLDGEVCKSHFDAATLTPQRIQRFYSSLKEAAYWGSAPETQAKRSWMNQQLASRLFIDFGPGDWSGLQHELVLELARELEAAPRTVESPAVPLTEWLLKMGRAIKAAPRDAGPRQLLAHFIANSGLALRDSFQTLQPLFSDDQAMFVALHQSPPATTPMRLWHQDAQVLARCVDLLEAFFRSDRADQWDLPLYGCLRDDYYRRYGQSLQDRLFSKIVRPIGVDDALAANIVRRQILADARPGDSYLLDSHRFEIAHHLLTAHPMTAPVPLAGAAVEVLQYVIAVDNSLNVTQPELYRSPILQPKAAKLGFQPPAGEADRILVYLNLVIGEPLQQMCNAFMGRATVGDVRFSLQDDARRIQLEDLLRTIVKWKGVLRVSHGDHQAAQARPKILEMIAVEIIHEMKAAIAARDKDQIVNLVRLTLKITIILDDDHYLGQVLDALRHDVFEIPEDPTRFRRLAREELAELVARFHALHSGDLVEVLRLEGQMKYFEMFYDQLYVPLRSVYGFFRQVGAEPYLLYLKEFASNRYTPPADLPRRWQREWDSFGRIHAEDGAGDVRYINAEEAIADLLRAYCRELGIPLWQEPNPWPLNRNINLGVLHRLLFQIPLTGSDSGQPPEPSEAWKLSGLSDDERSRCYQRIAMLFLEHVPDASLRDRTTGLDDPSEEYTPREFLRLLHALTELYEIHGFRFRGLDPAKLYTGTPPQGIAREILVGALDLQRAPVDGSLRAAVFRYYWQAMEGSDDAVWEPLVPVVLLLPNSDQNNRGGPDEIAAYETLKGQVFEHLASLLDTASRDDHDRCFRLLRWLCLLEASVYGLADESRGFGYETLRAKVLRHLETSRIHDLALEEFRLMHVNQGMAADGEALSLLALAQIVQQVVDALCGHYVFAEASQRVDRASHFILDVVRAMRKEKVLEKLQKEHLDEFWFLTTYCRNAILLAESRGVENLSEDEKTAVVAVASRLIFLHTYFAPYVDAEFDKDAMYDSDYALPLFCMLQGDVKKPLVRLLSLYEATYRQAGPLVRFPSPEGNGDRDVPIMEPRELETFLICHNFLPIYLLEASLADATRFCRLIDREDVEMTAYNFRILWERKDLARVSLESLCQEVFDGVDLNRDILAGSRQLRDEDYLQYFFGDMRAVFDGQSRYSAEMPQNFDSLVRRFAVLPDDPGWKGIKDGIEQALRDSNVAADAKRQARYQAALADLGQIRHKVDTVLGGGYRFFGSVLADRFRSPFTIQKACELAGQNVAAAAETLQDDALASYRSFYLSSLFGKSVFREEIEQALVARFYPPPKQTADGYLAERRADYVALIEGHEAAETRGLVAAARKLAADRTEFDTLYLDAGKRLLQSLFCGRHVPEGRPFLGDLVWDLDERGERRAKPLDYEQRSDDIRDLVLWIRHSAERYTSVPELREVFVAPGALPAVPATKTKGAAP